MVVCLVSASVLLGCASSGARSYSNESPSAAEALKSERLAELGPGDVFEVRVYGEKELSGLYRVAPNGTIDFALAGTLEVSGKTPDEVAMDVRERLKNGYIRNPYVTVYVREYNSKKVFVLGQVQKPGTFTFQEKMTIVQAITLAGGFTSTANRGDTLVTRTVDGKETRYPVPVDQISVGLAPNFLLTPGDIIFVPESLL